LATNDVISIANRNIEQVSVVSNYIFVRVPLPYELKLDEQRRIVGEIVELVKDDSLVEDCENIGLAELADSKIEYLLKITIDPSNKLQAKRNTLEHIVEGLEKNGVDVPYNQLDVHQK
ncbi:MAG: mechanosensitive ion channel family protein, partial [Clostridia bacterium]|nr:mechanosensitive ion channel family protein [Clostridia bacterium]